jgi:hypothetical protein
MSRLGVLADEKGFELAVRNWSTRLRELIKVAIAYAPDQFHPRDRLREQLLSNDAQLC